MHFPTDRRTHATNFDRPVVYYWLDQKFAQAANATAVQDGSGAPNLYRRVLYRLNYVPLRTNLMSMPPGHFRFF